MPAIDTAQTRHYAITNLPRGPDFQSGWEGSYLINMSQNLRFLWARHVGSGSSVVGSRHSPNGLAIGHDGAIYAAGRFWDTEDFDPGPGKDEHTSEKEDDLFISKLTPNGFYDQ